MAVIYFSGVHGSGKTTLLIDLSIDGRFIKTDKLDLPKPSNILERQLIRLSRYYLQRAVEKNIENKFPEKTILSDRSFYDVIAYSYGFEKLGWISKGDYEKICAVKNALFDSYGPKIVHVNPSVEFVRDRLNERWQKEGKKWREDDFEYLDAVREGYSELFKSYGSEVLELTETDRDGRVEMARDWIFKNR